jgi:hypothetical protein
VTNGKRSALVVANDAYKDPKLRRLRAPAADAEELARVLNDPEIGGFEVEVSSNEPEHVVRRRLAAFFQDRGLDDLLVLHLSCHGLKDDDGNLYFATSDTEVAHLDATSLPSEFVNRQMTRSRSRRIVLLLDCCYSGAFASGMLSRAGDRVDIKERFDGRGRVVLTASSAMEYSFEGDELSGAGNPSVFTSALVRGLETGEADRDRDGWISVEELYDYAYDQVRAVTPSQTPGKWTFDVQGELYLARSSLTATQEPIELPGALQSAIQSPFAYVRAGAVEELAGFLRGADAALAGPAREALERLTEDDSRRVSDAAVRALAEPPLAEPARPVVTAQAAEVEGTTRPPEVEETTRPEVEETRPPVPAARAPSSFWTVALALAGDVALLLPFLLPLPGDKSLLRYIFSVDQNLLLVYSPIELGAVALAIAGVAVASWRGRIHPTLGAGLLVGFGLLATAAAVALLIFASKYLGFTGLDLVALAAILILAAGLLLARTSSPAPRAGPLTPTALWLGIAGVALTVLSLFLFRYRGASTLAGEAGQFVELAFEPFLALAAMIVALVLLSGVSRSPFAAGLLLAVGAQTALHFVGVVVGASATGGVREGGFVGLLGALLVATAGAYAYRSGKPPAGTPSTF